MIQLDLAIDVDALYRLIEHQQIGLAQQCPRQQDALQFATGYLLQRPCDQVLGADFGQRRLDCRASGTGHQQQKTQYRQWQRRIDLQLLRHVADAQARLAPDLAPTRLEQAEHDPHQAGLAGTIGTYQRDNLATPDAQVHTLQHVGCIQPQTDVAERQQLVAHAAA